MAFLSSLVNYGNKALDWYNNNPIISDVAVPGLATLYNQYQQNSANKTATGQMTTGINQGLSSLNQFYGTARQDAAPYMASGLQGLSQYQGLLANLNAVKESEDYKFRFAEGQQALERSAAAKGMLMSGNTLQELQQYGQGFATRELDAALQRRIPLMETGLTSQRSLAELGQGYANAIAELYGQRGDVAALGTRTGANTTTGTLGDTLGILSDLNKARTAVDGPVLDAAKSIGNYLGGNAAANAGALNGLGAVGGTVAGLGSIGGAGIGTGAAALGGGGFGAGLGSAGLGGVGIGGAGAGTLPGMGGSAAAFNSMSSGIGAQALGASGAGAASTGLQSFAAAAPYFAAVLAGPQVLKAISHLSGGASDRTKLSKAAAWFQKSPEAGFQNLDNIINNVKWSNESSNIGVITGMVDAGVINVAYPTLHSANSILDVWSGTNRLNRRKTRSYGYKGNKNPLSLKLEAQTYGMNEAQQQQYTTYANQLKQAVNRVDRDPDTNGIRYVDDPGDDRRAWRRRRPRWGIADSIYDVPQGAYVRYNSGGYKSSFTRVDQLPGYSQIRAIRSQYMTEDRKRATAQNTYQQLRNAGYTGDLTKLEKYLRIK